MRWGRAFTMLLLAAAGIGGWHVWTRQQTGGEQTRAGGRRSGPEGPAAVTATPVRIETVPVVRDGIGNIQAFALVTVRSQIDGLLTAVEFREGQAVTRGMVLARIDPTTWQAQLDQALAKKTQNEATLANARVDLARYRQLAASNAGSKQQADQQQATVAQLEAQVKADQAAIDNARAYLGYTTITSPIDGRAGLRQVDPGNIIRAGDTAGLVTIAQLKPIAAVFTLPQRDLAVTARALAAGLVTVEAFDADGRSAIASGRLDVIDNQVDTATGTIKLKATFPNDDQRLWPGQFVTVRVRVGELRDALVVPTPAVRRGPQGTFVYVVAEGDVAATRAVTIVQQDERIAVIAQGVQAGDRVITAGFGRLTEGKPVVVPPDSAPPAVAPPRQAPAANRRGGAQGRPARRP